MKSRLEKRAETFPPERPSRRILRIWAKRIARGKAPLFPVFVGGIWKVQISRGHKRILELAV